MSAIAIIAYGQHSSGKAAEDVKQGQTDAAAISERAAEKNIDFQKWLWGEQKELLQPYASAGEATLPAYLQEVNKGFTLDDFYSDPGYQFGLNEGTRTRENSASSGGMTLSGTQQKALQRYGTDYASTKYNEAFNRRQVGLDNLYRMIVTGSNAAGGQATTGTAMGNQVSSAITGAGQAGNTAYQNIGNVQGAREMAGYNTLMDIGNLAVQGYGYSRMG